MRRLTFLFIYLVTQLNTRQVTGQDKGYSISTDTIQLTYTPAYKNNQTIKAGIGLPLLRRSSVSPTFIGVAIDVAGERTINRNVSVVGGLESHYLFSRYAQLYSLELPLGLRYYFSVGKKMKRQANAASFFRHYIAFQTHSVLFADLTYNLPNPGVERYYRGQRLDHMSRMAVNIRKALICCS